MIELAGACVCYGAREVIRGIDLSLRAGETTVLLGRSGSGKTTLLRAILGIALPRAGEVRVAGRSTREWDLIALRRRTGYVLQEGGLFPHYSVARNVGLVPELEGWAPARIATRVAELLALVGLPVAEFGARFPHQLSGGQRQRVGVARALGVDPPLLLCDEPFGALDPITRAELQREFGQMARSLGKTIVFVTHDVREALTLGDRIVLLVDGQVAVDTPAAELRDSTHPEARAFLASLGQLP
ncbi:MAG TPA: ATP-binding cassette domain-containing protein [Kofleriaceae bacterium]|nr:ATP-binding cassette domain-containing protein [Kofleriaceae bacterium]